jgi:hypothetical protein
VGPRSPPVRGVPVTAGHSGASILRNVDLLVLLLALPVFILADAPIEGYLAVMIAWLAGRVGMELAARRRSAALRAQNRNAALGITAFATMGRVWLMAGAILLVGLLVDRDAGLAAAILALVLVTCHVVTQFADHVLHPETAELR